MKKTILILVLFFGICLSGFSQNAQDLIDNLKTELKSNPDQKRAAIIYSDLTWYYSNISIDSAMIYGKKAINESIQVGDSTIIAQVYADVGSVYLKKGDYDQCLKYFNKVLTIRKIKNDIPGLAKTYSGIAMVYNLQSKYELSMKNYLIALDYINKTNDDKIKNNIKYTMSGLLLDLKDYKKALLYSQQSIAFFENIKSAPTLCPMYINNGNIYLGLKDTLNAMKMYEKARFTCGETGNKLFLSKALNNIGVIQVAQKKYEDSDKFFNESKQNRKDLNSETLDYKMKFNDVDVLNREQKFSKSKKLLIELKNYFEKSKDDDNLITAYKILIPVCSNLRENDSVSFYQTKFLDLTQKLNDSEILKKTIELETKYQTAKKEKQLLQKEIEIKKSRDKLLLVSIAAIFILLFGFLIYRQQKLKNKQQEQEFQLQSAIKEIENQNNLQEQRLSISRDLHDNIGAQLTFVISSVDNLKLAGNIKDSKINKQLNMISEFTKATILELRDTIWAMNSDAFSFEDLRSRLFNFIEKAQASTSNLNISFSIDDTLFQNKISSISGITMYRIIQEAINNAIKHANASKIDVTVAEFENQIKVTILDNGSGFDKDEIEYGNGILNMQKRAEDFEGEISIDAQLNSGTKITFTISKDKLS